MSHYKILYFDDTFVNGNEFIEIMSLKDFTMEEIKQAVLSIRNKKAPGLNGIHFELIKYGCILVPLKIQRLLNKVWKAKIIPEVWKMVKVITPLI